MTIRDLDTAMKNLVSMHHVYGVECLFNALARACKDDKYLQADNLHRMLDWSINFVKEDNDDQIKDLIR